MARNGRSYPPYRHKALTDDRSIRLLKLLPGSQDALLQAECMVISFDDPGHSSYEAISYTWGAPALSCSIIVDGQSYNITQSAHDVLVAIRSTETSRLIWIDSICINQSDRSEKTIQLQLMREVYSSAIQVVAWLGHGEQGDAAVYLLLKRLRQLYDLNFEDYIEQHGEPIPPYPNGNWSLQPAFVLEYTWTNIDSPGWQGLRRLLRRPWFRRIWVYQEAVLAQKLILKWGNFELDFADVGPVIHWLMFGDANQLLHHRSNPAERQDQSIKFGWMHLSRMRETRFERIHEQKALPFEDHMCEPCNWEATDPRDFVYGVLGMVAERDEPELMPDYTKDVSKVFTEATKMIIKRNKSLRPLVIAGDSASDGSVPNLPSWVPNYAAFRRQFSAGTMNEAHLSAIGAAEFSVSFSSDNELNVRGIVLGSVTAIGSPNTETGRQTTWQTRNLALGEWVDKSLATMKPKSTAFLWRTLACNDPELLGNFHHLGYDTWFHSVQVQRRSKLSRKYWKSMKYLTTNVGQDWMAQAARYAEVVSVKTVGKMMATVTTGAGASGVGGETLAIVPPQCQVCDVVCILFGLSVPIVLRPQRTRRDGKAVYKVVGGCYVDGVGLVDWRSTVPAPEILIIS